ncbi:MAG: class I SAM-dependent methyltransferase [Gammaproteobacteria bacterium]|nr:class I SAM-dependent methyltransferase [Gammaproteobacteria bacterium]
MGAESFYWENFERPYLEEKFSGIGKAHPGRYLDFAVGTGRILEIAAPNFSEVVGIDVSEDMLKQARKKVPKARLIKIDITSENLDLDKFNVISSFRFVLNAEPALREAALQSLRLVIEDGGCLIINNHLNKWSFTGLVCRFSNFIHGKPRHKILSDTDIRYLLERCEFKVLEKYGFGLIPTWRNRLLLWSGVTYKLECFLNRSSFLQKFAKDRIYICQPI